MAVYIFLQLEKLEQETVRWCREILRNSPTAIRVLKSSLNAVDDGHAGLQVKHFCNMLSRFFWRNYVVLVFRKKKTILPSQDHSQYIFYDFVVRVQM